MLYIVLSLNNEQSIADGLRIPKSATLYLETMHLAQMLDYLMNGVSSGKKEFDRGPAPVPNPMSFRLELTPFIKVYMFM